MSCPGRVISDVAASVDLVDLDAFASEEVVAGEDIGAMRVTAQGENRRVLEHQERVADDASLAGGNDPLLDREGLRVGNAAEMEEVYEHYFLPGSGTPSLWPMLLASISST